MDAHQPPPFIPPPERVWSFRIKNAVLSLAEIGAYILAAVSLGCLAVVLVQGEVLGPAIAATLNGLGVKPSDRQWIEAVLNFTSGMLHLAPLLWMFLGLLLGRYQRKRKRAQHLLLVIKAKG